MMTHKEERKITPAAASVCWCVVGCRRGLLQIQEKDIQSAFLTESGRGSTSSCAHLYHQKKQLGGVGRCCSCNLNLGSSAKQTSCSQDWKRRRKGKKLELHIQHNQDKQNTVLQDDFGGGEQRRAYILHMNDGTCQKTWHAGRARTLQGQKRLSLIIRSHKQAKGLRLSNQKANARPVYVAHRLSPVAANLCKSIAAVKKKKKQRILVFKHKVAAHIPACFVPFLDL